ncbi:helix-turn-helix domain-containing protein [Sinanaerobacter chloroacetimidivorans]|jgi:transcriptional regulator with XRE-family HTH domain|uniref:Helix-turn-helix transcriptional regulator n=1 Tax=Sinanaerobacter chloroacetimidivorans TaxID=2818044 RepID=A0A8J7W5S3_9FIRM|nr:helix-turn-helix transcriptional regulator [Sinanaerobacter chloroacetimidivorans]MBR0599566.1 helix-turn-helix transcriptional regulator [Sinanaerobacter chloroacetimidivorans]
MRVELDLKAMGKRIRNQREQMRLTREELAEKLGVSSKFCADIEYGVKGMSLSTLLNLSIILNLSVDYILKGYGDQLGIRDDDNRVLKESIMIPLNSCSRTQLKRVEQMVKIFVAAVNEDHESYDT